MRRKEGCEEEGGAGGGRRRGALHIPTLSHTWPPPIGASTHRGDLVGKDHPSLENVDVLLSGQEARPGVIEQGGGVVEAEAIQAGHFEVIGGQPPLRF